MKERHLTYQLNPLIEAQKSFNVMETRLFYLGLQRVNPHLTDNDKYYDNQFPDIIVTPSELTKIFGHRQYLAEVDKAADNLIGRYISIYFEKGFEKYTIFQHIKYREGQGLFIKFNEDMRPFILDIYKSYKKYGFTKIEMQQIFILSSTYAMRLLELLLQYHSTAKNGIIEREIDIDDLRKKLNVPEDAYKGRIGNFRKKVLDSPINDINTHTKYYVDYSVIKQGRNVKSFKFTCNCNNVVGDDEYTTTIDSHTDWDTKDLQPIIEENENSQEKLYTKLINYGFSVATIEELLKKCGGVDELSKRLAYGEQRAKEDNNSGKEVSSISGYLRKAIEDNWLQDKVNIEKAQEKELQAVKDNAEWELWAKKKFSNEPTPNIPENPFDPNVPMDKILINMIKSGLKSKKLSLTAKARLQERGLTIARFIELYT